MQVDHDALEERSKLLRAKLLPLPNDKVLAAWSRVFESPPRDNVKPGLCHTVDPNMWFAQHCIKKDNILGYGRCQFVAFSRAAFSSDAHADELRDLAVTYLRLHKATFAASIQVYLQKRRAGMARLVKEKRISSAGYDGYMEALGKGLEWGNDQTLNAMTILMRTECRLLQNTLCPASQDRPRLVPIRGDPRDKVGCVENVVYLFLQDEHYSALQNGSGELVAADADAESVCGSELGSMHTDHDNEMTYSGEPITVHGEDYSASDLCNGLSLGDGTRIVMKPSDKGDEWIISMNDMRTGGHEELRRVPRIMTRKPSNLNTPRRKRAPEDVGQWTAMLQREKMLATPDLAQCLHEMMAEYIEKLELQDDASDGSALGKLSSLVLDLFETLRECKHRLAFTSNAEAQPNSRVLVAGSEGAGKSTLINHLIRHAIKNDEESDDSKLTEDNVYPPIAGLSETKLVEEALKRELPDRPEVLSFYNLESDDVLPTGEGAGAMTALVQHARYRNSCPVPSHTVSPTPPHRAQSDAVAP